MEWLQESVQLHTCSHIDEVLTTLLMQAPESQLILEAIITENSCIMTKMKHQDAE